jgi:tetratricopeptide (TPR) repeat protein
MTGTMGMIGRGALLCSALALTVCTGIAQGGQASPDQPKQQVGQTTDEKKPQNQSLQLEIPNAAATPVVNAEEEAAFKAFLQAVESEKQIQAGEAFLQKHPQSQHRAAVYSKLVTLYVLTGGPADKMLDAGKKAIELNPNDVNTLALMGQIMARQWQASSPTAAQDLDTAEQYSKRVIQLVPTVVKPADVSDAAFTQSKALLLSMAHSGLGLVDMQRKKFADAVPELEESLKDPSQADPVNYYLLGVADMQIKQFDGAATALTKCGAISGPLQDRCKSLATEAMKQASTQLSAPK